MQKSSYKPHFLFHLMTVDLRKKLFFAGSDPDGRPMIIVHSKNAASDGSFRSQFETFAGTDKIQE